MNKEKHITIAHGGGFLASRRLIEELFAKRFGMSTLDDAADIGDRCAVTTDAHVVQPLFFPGGDIGSLSVNGTCNDLAVQGAVPQWLTATFILQDGFPMDDLERIVDSMASAAEEAGVRIVAGDTKVVQRQSADGVFITTTGIGRIPAGVELGSHLICPGDEILVSGTLGDHAISILNLRNNLQLTPAPRSDCASLFPLIKEMLNTGGVRFLRDATRGGVAGILSEIADTTRLSLEVEEALLPVRQSVQAVAEMLGLDPLFLANEGKLVAICHPDSTAKLLETMRSHPLGRDACRIGSILPQETSTCYLKTTIGASRPLILPEGDPLPRIC